MGFIQKFKSIFSDNNELAVDERGNVRLNTANSDKDPLPLWSPELAIEWSSVIAAIVRIYSYDIASQTTLFYTDEKGNKVADSEDELLYLWNINPSNTMDGFSFREILARDFALLGNAMVRIQTDKKGNFEKLLYLPFNNWSVVQTGEDSVAYTITNEWQKNEIILPQSQVLHFKFYSAIPLSPNPLVSAKMDLETIKKVYRLMQNSFDSAFSQKYKLPMASQLFNSVDEEKQLVDAFTNKYVGENSSAKVIPYDRDKMDIQILDDSNTSILRYINQILPLEKNVAAIYGIPISRLSNAEDSHSSAAQVDDIYTSSTLPEILLKWESEINAKCLNGRKGHYFFDKKTMKIDDIATLSKAGVITAKEAKQLLKLNV